MPLPVPVAGKDMVFPHWLTGLFVSAALTVLTAYQAEVKGGENLAWSPFAARASTMSAMRNS
jgi:hypothetical protein